MSEGLFALSPSSNSGGRVKRDGAGRIRLATFLDACKARCEPAISNYQPIFLYAESIGLPIDMLQLAWFEFCRQFGAGGASESKLQIDWRRTFRNYVERGYLKLWYLDNDGVFQLTQTGRQARLANAHRMSA
ncbi:MAG: hypothetical protein A3E01_00085 [Gammaproteobacteria bacterium RIFCSPHIGHO2_12_FULL_63_22]|nr:MAG: hypothetical protein A3E01_00085 [Gammaproteobacteria bacterium RIFCSPHIGHO2_12_FULL_63_22]